MSHKGRKVRSFMVRTYVTATVASVLLFALTIMIFGFTLEDQIFDLQVNEAASALADIPPSDAHGQIQTLDMTYYVGTEAMPAWLREKIDPAWDDRNFEVFGEGHGHFHAAVRSLEGGQKLYVLFNARRFIRSTPQIIRIVPWIAGMAGLVLLVALLSLIRVGQKVSRPLEDMAQAMAEGNRIRSDINLPGGAPVELVALADAIRDRDERIDALIEREREFNRDASHELRTPLAVAYGAAEVIEDTHGGSRALTRLKSSITNMQTLTDGILWLSRDPTHFDACDVAAVAADSIAAYRHLLGNRQVAVRLEAPSHLTMPLPEAVAHVIVGNILRNALSYTEEGEVVVEGKDGELRILDTGVGFGKLEPGREGFGIGLTLVERLCRHFSVEFDVRARQAKGTEAILRWQKPPVA